MRKELPLHDAAFNGVILKDKTAHLHFVRTDGQPYVVQLLGIDAMQMDDFREGNIVVLFEAVSGELPWNSVAWDRLYAPPHPSAAREYHKRHEDLLQRKRTQITENELTLVQMVPAIGADLLVVCQSMETKSG